MKKPFKTAMVLLFALSLLLLTAIPATAANHTGQADHLNRLGLLRGTGNGYELDRESMRVEAATMLVRLLGKESEALGGSYVHPFTDVPAWADKYVGYLYANGLTKGTSPTTFSPDVKCDANMYAVFMLRTLGYSEAKGDFTYAGAPEFAEEIGLLDPSTAEKKPFLRDDIAAVSYSALFQKPQGVTYATLLDKLVSEHAVSAEAAYTDQQLYKTYNEFTAACMAAQIQGSVKLEQYMNIQLQLLGQTGGETVKSLITIAKGGNGTIVKTEDEFVTPGKTEKSTSYYVDGWVYTTDSDGTRYKYQGTPPPVEEALTDNATLPLYRIENIEKTIGADGNAYSITFSPGMYDKLAEIVLKSFSGDESTSINILSSSSSMGTSFDLNGGLRFQNLYISLDANITDGETTIPLHLTLDSRLNVLETGDNIKVSLPSDLGSFPEN